jgi:hypothetical protein
MNGFKITEQGDIVDKIYKHRDNYHKKGKYLGWEQLHKHYSMTLGNCTDWTGYPMSGKTQVLMELLVNTSKFYGWKHLIYFPDVGNNVEIVADLIHKKTGKSFNPNAENAITDIEITHAMEWVLRHFKIVTRKEVKGNLSPVDFWEWAIKIRMEEELHTASIDSWKDLNHDYEKFGGYAQYLEYILPLRNHIAEENNLHLHTIIHPKLTEKENGKRPAPTPYDLKGGSEWFNSGKSMITVHREDILSNEVTIYFNKIKPRSIGEVGSIKLYFDKDRLTYYFQDIENNNYTKFYASEQRNVISNSFPTKIPLQKSDIVNGKELISFSEKLKQNPF